MSDNNKYIDSIFRDELASLVRSDRFISEKKVQEVFEETLKDLNKTLTDEQIGKVRESSYKVIENKFIRELQELFSKYGYILQKGNTKDFVKEVNKIYDKYGINLEDSSLDLSDEEKAIESRKRDKFDGRILTLCSKYISQELLIERVDALARTYVEDDFVQYIDRITQLLDLQASEVTSIKEYLIIKYIDNAFSVYLNDVTTTKLDTVINASGNEGIGSNEGNNNQESKIEVSSTEALKKALNLAIELSQKNEPYKPEFVNLIKKMTEDVGNYKALIEDFDLMQRVYKEPYIITRLPQIFALYQIFKSQYYNDDVAKDDYGIINLDEYAFITAKRKTSHLGMPGSWIISSNLESFFARRSARLTTDKDNLFNGISEALKIQYGDDYIYWLDYRIRQLKTSEDAPDDIFLTFKSLAKKIRTVLEEPVSVESPELSDKALEQLKPYAKKVQEIIENRDLSDEEKLKKMRAVDEVTPTTTSDEELQKILDEWADPTVSISMKEIISSIATENELDLEEREMAKQEKIDTLVARLAAETCEILGIEDEKAKIIIGQKLYTAIVTNSSNIKEKNTFFMPQIAKQMGLDAAIFYKATESDERMDKSFDSIESLLNILKNEHLVDDTKEYLTRDFLKPDDQELILASRFMPDPPKNGLIKMSTIFKNTREFLNKYYAGQEASYNRQLEENPKLAKDKEFQKNRIHKEEAQEVYDNFRKTIIKRTIFNKLISFTEESNDYWGFIKDKNGRLRPAPKFEYEASTDSVNGKNIKRVVRNNQGDISDFLIEYATDPELGEWFRNWIDTNVVNLDFEKACREMTRITGVTLNDREQSYYQREVFDKVLSVIQKAHEDNFDVEKIIEERKKRETFGEKIYRTARNAKGKFTSNIKLRKILPRRKNDAPDDHDER